MARFVGLMVSDFFISVPYHPFFWINFAMTVTLNNSALNALRDDGSVPLSDPSTAGRRVGVYP